MGERRTDEVDNKPFTREIMCKQKYNPRFRLSPTHSFNDSMTMADGHDSGGCDKQQSARCSGILAENSGAKPAERPPLKRLGEEVSHHIGGGTETNDEIPDVNPVGNEEVAIIEMASSLGGGTLSIFLQ